MTGVRNENSYEAIKQLHEAEGFAVKKLCNIARVNRGAYYKWLKRKPSHSQIVNERISRWIKELYEEQNGILGYRQMTITINRRHRTSFNPKRIYRLMNLMGLRSVCRRKHRKYIRTTPEIIAENILNRKFYADKPNEKWLTDVTEFKYNDGAEIKKLYLSAILDLYDRRIVSFKISASNNNPLVFDTFDEAMTANPGAHPLLHSDRGYQYTSKVFRAKLEAAGIVQSMSRVGHCIDNGPMEGFWGILKSEMYYLRRFNSAEELVSAIKDYICFYNTKRYQKRLRCMTPMEFHNAFTT